MTTRVDDGPLFAELRALKITWSGKPVGLTADEVRRVKAALDRGDPSDLVTFGPAPQPVAIAPPVAETRLTVKGLQRRMGVEPDGQIGPASRAALAVVLTNRDAPGLTDADIERAAADLGVGANIIRAVRKVEAPRGAYDVTGKPTHLYERHVANRNTDPVGQFAKSHPLLFGPTGYGRGGYGAFSAQFDKLAAACALDPQAAFAGCSWGAFQVLGENARALGYASPYHFALALTKSEGAHLDSFVRFVKVNGLVDELRLVQAGKPDSAIPFVSRYNGPGFRQFDYHVKLTEAAK